MKQDTPAPWAETVPNARYPMTADDLLRRADDLRDTCRYELVEGRLVRMSPTSDEHFYIMDNLHPVLRAFVKAHQLGIVTYPDNGFLISSAGNPETIVAPDIAFVRAERIPPRSKKYLAVAPDLVVEIASPTQYRPEMAEKARLYLRSGVRLVWVVWPGDRQVDVWRPGSDVPVATLGESDALDGLDVLPGFTHAVANLFA